MGSKSWLCFQSGFLNFRYGRTCSSAVRNYSFKRKVHIATPSNSLHPHHQSPAFPSSP
ncbi:hypothetical protein M404DRAFT_1003887 [Pisolithus tinctorius Marx 270]|uniref:Uncharacterized protein n=1 Tax=Pisolithus tinctorius Marx 270 TaxID=870435 RepID=A0A0C3JSJ3_PISTI|nr:hypothetical protein M404DRAFT_1003887 [Pisolithus tinctorius Marx 270]